MSGLPPAPPQASPRIVHTALFAGALFMTPFTAFLRWIYPAIDLEDRTVLALRFVAIALLIAQAVVVRVVRNRIEALLPEESEEAWWSAYLSPCLVIWGLGVSLAIVGSGFFFLTGDWMVLGVAGGGLVLLFLSNPTRLMSD